MTPFTLPLSTKEQVLELSAILAHCPLERHFLHLGASDGLLCQMAGAFVQFEGVIGLDYCPKKVALCLYRKKRWQKAMERVHFHFHDFMYPFREVPLHTVGFLSSAELSEPQVRQLCHWIERTPGISSIGSVLVLPLKAGHWRVKGVEEMNMSAFYIYERLV